VWSEDGVRTQTGLEVDKVEQSLYSEHNAQYLSVGVELGRGVLGVHRVRQKQSELAANNNNNYKVTFRCTMHVCFIIGEVWGLDLGG